MSGKGSVVLDVQQNHHEPARSGWAAIALHYLAGLSVPETARALGVSENTVKSQLKTGLARLREDLHDD